MKMNLPSRKELNQTTMEDLISELAEFVGGDQVIHGELFSSMFNDLSATKQEYYIRLIQKRLKDVKSN